MYKLIDGNAISKKLLDSLKEKANVLNVTGKNRVLADIQVGLDEASSIYIENKTKKFHDVGLKFKPFKLPENTTENELIDLVEKLNNDKDINGIFIEMPLPKHINANNVVNKISPLKDVEGCNIASIGGLTLGMNCFYPCTAEGIIYLLKENNIEMEGKNCVVIGRSNIVGKPVALLMLKENATVTICHSKTKNIKDICKNADILIVATGKPNSVDDTYVKEGAVVVDVGIHKVSINGELKTCGDVDFDKVSPHTSYITPVPGGVGPMTVSILIKHCLDTVNNE